MLLLLIQLLYTILLGGVKGVKGGIFKSPGEEKKIMKNISNSLYRVSKNLPSSLKIIQIYIIREL